MFDGLKWRVSINADKCYECSFCFKLTRLSFKKVETFGDLSSIMLLSLLVSVANNALKNILPMLLNKLRCLAAYFLL